MVATVLHILSTVAQFLLSFWFSFVFTSFYTSYYLILVGRAEQRSWWLDTVITEWPGSYYAIRDNDYLIAYGGAAFVAGLLAVLAITIVHNPWLITTNLRSDKHR